MVAQPPSSRAAAAAPKAGRICLAKEIRLRSISMLLMTGVATVEQAKAEDVQPLGLYVHVPFCATTCDFCAFYQVHPTAESIEGFIKSLSAEAGLVDWNRPLSTVFWGGGTPGLLSPPDLGRVAALVHTLPGGKAPPEWTVELAP